MLNLQLQTAVEHEHIIVDIYIDSFVFLTSDMHCRSERGHEADTAPLHATAQPLLQVDTLLHLHDRKKWVSKRGANGNPAEGTGGPKRRKQLQDSTPALKVPVPMGTVIKDKKANIIAELVQPGDGYCICRGGAGGRGTLIPAKRQQPTTKREAKLEVLKPPPTPPQLSYPCVPLPSAYTSSDRSGGTALKGQQNSSSHAMICQQQSTLLPKASFV